jgi:hypothetical protein
MLLPGMKIKTLVNGSYTPGWTPNKKRNMGYGPGVSIVTEDNRELIEVWIRCGRAVLLDAPKLKGFYEVVNVHPVAGPTPGNDPVSTPAKRKYTKRSTGKL